MKGLRTRLIFLPGDTNKTIGRPTGLAERLWAKVNGPWHGDAPGPDECWEWMGKSAVGRYIMRNGRRIQNSKQWSYGRIRLAGAGSPIIGAHVAAYIVTYGPVPVGMYVCHTCNNHRCCNPSHLVAQSPAQNNQDTIRQGRRNRDKVAA